MKRKTKSNCVLFSALFSYFNKFWYQSKYFEGVKRAQTAPHIDKKKNPQSSQVRSSLGVRVK